MPMVSPVMLWMPFASCDGGGSEKGCEASLRAAPMPPRARRNPKEHCLPGKAARCEVGAVRNSLASCPHDANGLRYPAIMLTNRGESAAYGRQEAGPVARPTRCATYREPHHERSGTQ